jgi:hypothetical protein
MTKWQAAALAQQATGLHALALAAACGKGVAACKGGAKACAPAAFLTSLARAANSGSPKAVSKPFWMLSSGTGSLPREGYAAEWRWLAVGANEGSADGEQAGLPL